MIKRIISLLCACVIVCSCGFIGASAEAEDIPVLPERCKTADLLFSSLFEGGLFTGEEKTVSRVEFLKALEQVLKIDTYDDKAHTFADVEHGSEFAESVYTAAALGWISEAENFFPNEAINATDAFKIAVSALGYSIAAESMGGYPIGYMRVAKTMELDRDISVGGEFDCTSAKIFMLNILDCDFSSRNYSNHSGTVQFVTSGKTYLNVLYDIYETEGIINATSYNSLKYNTEIEEKKQIEIEGISFEYDGVRPELLANYCTAYYHYDKESGVRKIVAMETDDDVLRLDLDDIEVDGNRLYYCRNGESRKKQISLDPAAFMIYNGRFEKIFDSALFDGTGYAVFINNDDDSAYDAVQIISYSHLVVESVDMYNRKIGDQNSVANSLDLNHLKDKADIGVKKADGTEVSVYSLKRGDVLQVKKSKDLQLVEIEILEEKVSGTVSTIYDDEYAIGGNRYSYTDYFEEEYLSKVKIGERGTFVIGYNGKLVSFSKADDNKYYGFLLGAKTEKMNTQMQIKLFSENGKIGIYETAKKIKIDGDSKNISDAFAAISIGGRVRNEAIKFALNSEGKINKIDFAENYDPARSEEQKADIDDNFIYYPSFSSSAILYRSPKKTFNGYYNVSSAVCMRIPEDVNDDERYFISAGADSVFGNNNSYITYAYDINEYGYAGLVITRGKASSGSRNDVALITDVYEGLNSDGATVPWISYWQNGVFYDGCLADDLVISTDADCGLVPGDVVRIRRSAEGVIYVLNVDFNYTKFAFDSSLSSNYKEKTNASLSYWFGMPYSSNGVYAQLMTEKDTVGKYLTDIGSLKNFNVSTKNVVRFDCETKQARPVTISEMKTYSSFDDNAEYMVLLQDCDAPICIFLFDNYKNRE